MYILVLHIFGQYHVCARYILDKNVISLGGTITANNRSPVVDDIAHCSGHYAIVIQITRTKQVATTGDANRCAVSIMIGGCDQVDPRRDEEAGAEGGGS